MSNNYLKDIKKIIPGSAERFFGRVIFLPSFVISTVLPMYDPATPHETVFTAFVFSIIGLFLYIVGQIRREMHSMNGSYRLTIEDEKRLFNIIKDDRNFTLSLISHCGGVRPITYYDLISFVDEIRGEDGLVDFLKAVSKD